MEKYGFIYLWYDRKRKMYYLGSHWGTETDGYICSSNRMRNVYKRRPHNFKRRVIQRNISRDRLLDEEHRWLQMISENDLGKRYYNLRQHRWGHWSTDENRRLTIGQKIAASPNRRENISKANKGKRSPFRGVKRSEEVVQKMKDNHSKPMLGKHHSEETLKKMSEAQKGRPKTPEHIMKSAASRTGQKRSEESRQRMSDAHKGTKKPWAGGVLGRKDSDEAREKKRQAALLREQKKRNSRLNIQ